MVEIVIDNHPAEELVYYLAYAQLLVDYAVVANYS